MQLSGGTSNVVPAGGFGSPALSSIFQERVPKATSTSSTATTSSTSSNGTSASPKPSSTGHADTGAIAGGVVGGAAALAIFTIIAVFVYRKRKRATRNTSKYTAVDDQPTHSPREHDKGSMRTNGHEIDSGTTYEMHGESRTPELGPDGEVHEMSNVQRVGELEARGK